MLFHEPAVLDAECFLLTKLSQQHMLSEKQDIGNKSMQNTSAYEEPRSSGKRLHEYLGWLCSHCQMNVMPCCQIGWSQLVAEEIYIFYGHKNIQTTWCVF